MSEKGRENEKVRLLERERERERERKKTTRMREFIKDRL